MLQRNYKVEEKPLKPAWALPPNTKVGSDPQRTAASVMEQPWLHSPALFRAHSGTRPLAQPHKPTLILQQGGLQSYKKHDRKLEHI